jgi:uncharacterized protein (TIGR02996 family)
MYEKNDERQALLRTIIDDPDDDAPRLIFADWLDENGNPEWAALIREMIRTRYATQPEGLNRLFPCLPPRYPIIMACDSYDGPHGMVGKCVVVRKGFIEEVYMPWADWNRHGTAIVLGHPVRHVHLSGSRPEYIPAEWSSSGQPYWYWDGLPRPAARLVTTRWEAEGTKEEERRARKELSDKLRARARSGSRC